MQDINNFSFTLFGQKKENKTFKKIQEDISLVSRNF